MIGRTLGHYQITEKLGEGRAAPQRAVSAPAARTHILVAANAGEEWARCAAARSVRDGGADALVCCGDIESGHP